MNGGRPPRICRQLLQRILDADLRDEVLADLDRIWRERCATHGSRSADRWYRRQLLSALVPSAGAAVDSVLRDVLHAGTQLRRHPAVGVVVVATLSLGIGATTAIFSAVHGVLVKPLPYDRPSELVMVTSRMAGSSAPRHVSGPDAVDMQESLSGIREVAGFGEPTFGPLTRVDRPEHALVVPMTWNLFRVLGVDVARGRIPDADDGLPAPADAEERPPTSVVISHAFWMRAFGGDPGAVGRVVHIWGGAAEIVGVLPEGVQLTLPPELGIPADADVWEALRRDVRSWPREGRWLRTVARLSEGVSPARAQREVDAFARGLREAHPHHLLEETELHVAPLPAAAAAPLRGPLWLLMAAALLVMATACANAANLLLARGAARAGEMAVRSSLGAGGARLVRQLLTESALLAVLGTVGGVFVALAGIEVLHRVRPADLPRLDTVGIDLAALGFAAALAVAVTVLCGALPAVQAARSGAAAALRESARSAVGRRWRGGLVVAGVALSVVLVFGAGLLVRSFAELQRVPLGFEPEGVLTVNVTQPLRPAVERRAYETDLLRAVRSLPGVVAAGIVFPLPMNGVYERSAEWATDGSFHDPTGWGDAHFRTVSPGYFEAMGLELAEGRSFTDTDADADREVPVAILDERLAAEAFPHRPSVGGMLHVRGMGADTVRARVVGVVEHAPQVGHRDRRPTVYFPRVFYQSHEVSVVARVSGDPGALALPLAATVRRVDPSFPADLVPMARYVDERLAGSRFLLVLMQAFGAIALLLGAVGLYGVLSYDVRRRTPEIGVRRAVGARAAHVVAEVVGGGMRLAVLGTGLGLVGALVLGQALAAGLFQVGGTDPLALAGTEGLVLAVALAASLVPALQAARVDPSEALRSD